MAEKMKIVSFVMAESKWEILRDLLSKEEDTISRFVRATMEKIIDKKMGKK